MPGTYLIEFAAFYLIQAFPSSNWFQRATSNWFQCAGGFLWLNKPGTACIVRPVLIAVKILAFLVLPISVKLKILNGLLVILGRKLQPSQKRTKMRTNNLYSLLEISIYFYLKKALPLPDFRVYQWPDLAVPIHLPPNRTTLSHLLCSWLKQNKRVRKN